MKHPIHYLLKYIPRKYLQEFCKIGKPALSIFYFGYNVYCPVCGKHFRKFLPYGHVTLRKNALCPNCFSLERHRLIWLYIKKSSLLSSHAKILHVAPEYAFIRNFKKINNLDYITGDLESPWANIKMDIQDIPFKDNVFDFIMCNHVLEHVEDDMKALCELYRVLKVKQWGIISVPINLSRDTTFEDKLIQTPDEREKYYGQKDHLREYGQDFLKRLQICGFKVETINFYSELTQKEIQYYGLSPDFIYKVTKEE